MRTCATSELRTLSIGIILLCDWTAVINMLLSLASIESKTASKKVY